MILPADCPATRKTLNGSSLAALKPTMAWFIDVASCVYTHRTSSKSLRKIENKLLRKEIQTLAWRRRSVLHADGVGTEPLHHLRDTLAIPQRRRVPYLHEILLERSCFLIDTISGIREKDMKEEEGSLRKSWGQGCSGEPEELERLTYWECFGSYCSQRFLCSRRIARSRSTHEPTTMCWHSLSYENHLGMAKSGRTSDNGSDSMRTVEDAQWKAKEHSTYFNLSIFDMNITANSTLVLLSSPSRPPS
jgi:hypothetical protein